MQGQMASVLSIDTGKLGLNAPRRGLTSALPSCGCIEPVLDNARGLR
jgi:hypothetical protein